MTKICRSNKHQDPKMNPDSAKYCSYCGDLLASKSNNWLIAILVSGLIFFAGVFGYQHFFANLQEYEIDSSFESDDKNKEDRTPSVKKAEEIVQERGESNRKEFEDVIILEGETVYEESEDGSKILCPDVTFD